MAKTMSVDPSFRMDLYTETISLCGQPFDPQGFQARIKAEAALLARWEQIGLAAGKGTRVNKLVRFPVADGYALYIIAKVGCKSCRLVHFPVGDGYSSLAVAASGACPRSTVDRIIQGDDAMSDLFQSQDDDNARYFDSLQPGQIVHYSSSHGWIRCQVVVDDYTWGQDKGHGLCLKPIACVGTLRHKVGDQWVGDWSAWDLYSVSATGDISHGYYAQQVQEGKPFRCHASDIYEAHRKLHPFQSDPTTAPVLALDPPAPTSAEITRQRLWEQLQGIRDVLEVAHRESPHTDPLDVLRTVIQRAEAALDQYTR